VLAVLVFIAYPLAISLGLFPVRDKYPEVRCAAEILRASVPDARVMPTWPRKIGAGRTPAMRFYFGLSLRPFDPDDRSQPPFVLLRDPRRRAELEGMTDLVPLFEGNEVVLYRRR